MKRCHVFKVYAPMTLMICAVIIGVLSIMRLTGHVSIAFQALAHVWVGILIGAWWNGSEYDEARPVFGWCALMITLVEVFAFLTS